MQKNCGILSNPMGKPGTVQMSQNVPIVHPTIIHKFDYFSKNTAFTDGTYRTHEQQRAAYYGEVLQFNDIIGLVKSNK